MGILATGWVPEKRELKVWGSEKSNEVAAGKEEIIVALEFIVCGFEREEILVAEEQNSHNTEH